MDESAIVRELEEKRETYKYLIVEGERMQHVTMKEKIRKCATDE